MIKWTRLAAHFLLLLAQVASFDDYTLKMLGVHGRNYNMTKGVPWIGCMQWNITAMPRELKCNSTNFFDKKLGCQGLVRVKHESFENYSRRADGEEVVIGEEHYELILGKCWNLGHVEHKQCLHEEECIAEVDESSGHTRGFAFCCCNTHYCNGKMTVRFKARNGTSYVPADDDPLLNAMTTSSTVPEPHSEMLSAVSIVIIIIALVAICYTTLFFILWLHFRMKRKSSKKTAEDVPLVEMGIEKKRVVIREGLTIAELIAQGKMGRVHKATYTNPATGNVQTVAVKTVNERKSFLLEEAVFLMCENKHANIVHYYGSNVERLFLVLAHHENGCLETYLKDQTFTPIEALRFLCSLMDGLSFLHERILEEGDEKKEKREKEAIVHRDIKSRNVLVKSDGSAALADFGLAMPVRSGEPQGRRWQVGTHRYMSPEMLAERANLNAEGLKKVDVYAAALIIWEVLNRTIVDEDDEKHDAQLPYSAELEEEVKAAEEKHNKTRWSETDVFQPSPIQYYLKTIVHQHNKRPVIRQKLKQHPITNELVRCTLDMWDFEVDARISAACTHSRLKHMIVELEAA